MKAFDFKNWVSKKLNESSNIVPPIDTDRFDKIPGLEGPFRFRNGRVLYYDPKEGRYYDRTTDMYLSDEEQNELI